MGFKHGWLIVFLAGCQGLLHVRPTHAEVLFRTEPERVLLSAGSGEEAKAGFTIINLSDSERLDLSLEPVPWAESKGLGNLDQWLRWPKSGVEVLPGKTKVIELVALIPKELRGEGAAMMFLTPRPQTGIVRVQFRLGVPMYVQARGTEKAQGEITRFVFMLMEERPETRNGFWLEVKNSGNTILLPWGRLKLSPPVEPERAQQMVFFNEPIFPGQACGVTVASAALPAGKYRADVNLVLDGFFFPHSGGDLPALASTSDFILGKP